MRTSLVNFLQKQPPDVLLFTRRAVLKNFSIFSHRKTTVLESLFNKVADLRPCNVFKKRLQHGCFPANIVKSFRAATMKIICERLLLPLEIFCKIFVDISYENASFGILENSVWLQCIYFLKVHSCRFENLPICSYSHKNNTLKISHS